MLEKLSFKERIFLSIAVFAVVVIFLGDFLRDCSGSRYNYQSVKDKYSGSLLDGYDTVEFPTNEIIYRGKSNIFVINDNLLCN